MRVRHHPTQMRRDFRNHPAAQGLVAEFDVRPHRRGTLHAKVLIFTSTRNLAHFYRHVLGIRTRFKGGTGGVVGAVVQTGSLAGYGDPKRPTLLWVADRRYFCLMGFTRGYLGQDVLTHESVHAAQRYVQRVKINTYGPDGDPQAERLAYPAGKIANGIARNLNRLKL